MVQVKKIRTCVDLKAYMNEEPQPQAEHATFCEDDTANVTDQTAGLQTELLQEVAA